jgi:uncharacterized membrane protein
MKLKLLQNSSIETLLHNHLRMIIYTLLLHIMTQLAIDMSNYKVPHVGQMAFIMRTRGISYDVTCPIKEILIS